MAYIYIYIYFLFGCYIWFFKLPDSKKIKSVFFFCASGIGAGMDIVVSSVKAYIGALNKMLGFQEKPPVKTPAKKTTVSA